MCGTSILFILKMKSGHLTGFTLGMPNQKEVVRNLLAFLSVSYVKKTKIIKHKLCKQRKNLHKTCFFLNIKYKKVHFINLNGLCFFDKINFQKGSLLMFLAVIHYLWWWWFVRDQKWFFYYALRWNTNHCISCWCFISPSLKGLFPLIL